MSTYEKRPLLIKHAQTTSVSITLLLASLSNCTKSVSAIFFVLFFFFFSSSFFHILLRARGSEPPLYFFFLLFFLPFFSRLGAGFPHSATNLGVPQYILLLQNFFRLRIGQRGADPDLGRLHGRRGCNWTPCLLPLGRFRFFFLFHMGFVLLLSLGVQEVPFATNKSRAP